jgi:hypothetical protein
MALPDFGKAYLNSYSPPPKLDIPKWLLNICGDYRQEIENTCTTIEVQRIEATMENIVTFRCSSGRTVRLRIPDEMWVALGGPALPPAPELETFYSPWPVLGWRGWQRGGKNDMVGYYGYTWETPSFTAMCHKEQKAPHVGHGCGVYLLKDPRHLGHTLDYIGLTVATNVIEHEHGYRVGEARCIALNIPPAYNAPGWDGIDVMPYEELCKYAARLLADPDSIPAP